MWYIGVLFLEPHSRSEVKLEFNVNTHFYQCNSKKCPQGGGKLNTIKICYVVLEYSALEKKARLRLHVDVAPLTRALWKAQTEDKCALSSALVLNSVNSGVRRVFMAVTDWSGLLGADSECWRCKQVGIRIYCVMAASAKRKQEEKHLQLLREMTSRPANRRCFDCEQRGPTYANMTVGSFICTTCSGILWVSCSLLHLVNYSFTNPFIHSLTHPPTHSANHSLPNSFTQSPVCFSPSLSLTSQCTS